MCKKFIQLNLAVYLHVYQCDKKCVNPKENFQLQFKGSTCLDTNISMYWLKCIIANYIHLFLQIQLFSGSHAVFRNNSAKNGGGISVFTPIIYKDTDVSSFYNTLCFIQYDALIADNLSPEEWNVCNYMYTILHCLYHTYYQLVTSISYSLVQ